MKTNIRKILVPLDSSEYTHAATVHACEIAKKHEARVAGLAVMDSSEIRSFVAPSHYSYLPVVQEAITNHRRRVLKKIDDIEKKFMGCCRENKVEAVETKEDGIAINLILEKATLFDLMVIGLRTFFKSGIEQSGGEDLGEILQRTSTPILAVKSNPCEINRVLVAYDGSVSSSRALRDFTLFAKPFDFKIDVLVADKDEEERRFHANKACLYMVDHGLDVGDVINSKAGASDVLNSGVTGVYDLIVCGIHSRARIKDLFVGSFTNELIKKQENCLFLSH